MLFVFYYQARSYLHIQALEAETWAWVRAGVDTAYIDNLSTEAISQHVDKQHRITAKQV